MDKTTIYYGLFWKDCSNITFCQTFSNRLFSVAGVENLQINTVTKQ